MKLHSKDDVGGSRQGRLPIVCHVITTLETGGAQNMLYKLLSARDSNKYAHFVIALSGEQPMAQRVRELGIPVQCLGISTRGWNGLFATLRLFRLLRRTRPVVVQTWMHHSDLLGGLCARLAGTRAVLWGIRHSNMDPRVTKRRTIWIARLCGLLSPFVPTLILCCSEASLRSHRELRYCEGKMVIVPNGFDTRDFMPDPFARKSVLEELGLSQDVVLIGLFARFHGMKDHRTFFCAAAKLASEYPEAHFVLCGDGMDPTNPALRRMIVEAGIKERYFLLGRRNDMPRLTAALDIATSASSSGEGFSNTLGEAMASGVVCTVTDVGDAAAILGGIGRIVPPGDPHALCDAWISLISAGPAERARLGQAARRRIEQYFSLPIVVAQYEGLYDRLVHFNV